MWDSTVKGPRMTEFTVYGNGNTLGQLVSICSHKGWYLSEFVEFQIFGTERPLGNVGVDDLEVKLVCLGNGLNSYRTWIPLQRSC